MLSYPRPPSASHLRAEHRPSSNFSLFLSSGVAEDFFAEDFFAEDFFAEDFFAEDFFAGDFYVEDSSSKMFTRIR